MLRRALRTAPTWIFVAVILFCIAFGAAAPFLGGSNLAGVTSGFGRDETLTGRTETWSQLVPVVGSQPLLGSGFGSFWTTARRDFYEMSNGHNGYLDILLDLGVVGLALFTCWLLNCARTLRVALTKDYALGSLAMCFLLMAVVYNTTESALGSLAEHMTAVVVFASLVVPHESEPAARRSRVGLRVHVSPQRTAGASAAKPGPPEHGGPVQLLNRRRRQRRGWARAGHSPPDRGELSIDLTYAIERERTIPAVRNHALRLARGNYIGIIDDDEFPPPNWLLTMYDGIQTFGVDGSLGPVHPFFDAGAPAWLAKSGLCELSSFRTGTMLHWSQTRTGNVLLKRNVFDAHGLRFDPSFRTGGSDQEFFRQAMARGCRFVAVEEAPVYEVVPPVRWARGYWVRRAFVNGFNAKVYADRAIGPVRRVFLTLKAVAGAVFYALALPVCALLGQHRLVACLEKGAYHLSRACASFGIELWKKRDF